MALLDRFPALRFAGIAWPYKRIRIKGGLRDHVHEYPHSPGGAPEKLGRKLYEISIEGIFLENLLREELADLYDRLGQLRAIFEAGRTEDLTLPNIGTIKAYASEWGQELVAKIRSGEMGDFQFREDQSAAFLANALTQSSPRDFSSKMDTLFEEAEENGYGSVFDDLQNAVNDVLAVFDQVDLGASLIEAKIRQVAGMCKELDQRIDIFDDPGNHRILDALHELWTSANDLNADLNQKSARLINYIVPQRMAIGDVAAAVYGDAGRGFDILQLNAIDDAFEIPAGAVLRYYQDAA